MKIRLIILFLFNCILLTASTQPFLNEWIDFRKTYYKIPVVEQRIYRIPKATLVAAGISTTPVEQFQLWCQGREVPIYTTENTGPISANGYLEFYGKPLDGTLDAQLFPIPEHHVYKDLSFFSDTSNYFLTVNAETQNLRYKNAVNSVATTQLPADSFYMHTNSTSFFRGGFSFNYNYGYGMVIGGQVVRSSVWDQGEGFASTPFNVREPLSFSIGNLRAFKNGPPMSLRHSVVGVWNISRNVTLSLNDSLVNSFDIDNLEQSILWVSNIPLSRVSQADAIKFTYKTDDWNYGLRVPQATSLYLTYPRRFYFDNLRLTAFNLNASANGNHLRITAFATDGTAPVAYDNTNYRRYVGVLKADSVLFALEPSEVNREIIIANQTGNLIRTISTMSVVQFRNYANAFEQGDYLIITNKRLFDFNGVNYVQAYKNYRASADGGGFNPIIVDVDEIADQFSYGIRKHPLGIKNFITYAANNFTVKPKYILLLGRGSDYLSVRYNGNNPSIELLNAVPTWGSPGSDNLLAATDPFNPTPIIPIGRIAAVNGQEIKTYLEKVKKFEALQRITSLTNDNNAWQKDVLQLIGGDDPFLTSYIANYMAGYSKTISDTLIGAKTRTFKRINNQNLSGDLQEITKMMNNGLGIISYFGHSSNSSIDFGISNPEDYIYTNGKYPVFIANGCKAGNIFDVDYSRLQSKNVSLSDNFNFADNRGSIGFISNSDFGIIGYLNYFTSEWFKNLAYKSLGAQIGDIQKSSIAKTYSLTGNSDYHNRVNLEQVILHADPALRIFPQKLPDYSIDVSSVQLQPQLKSIALDTLNVTAKIRNLGSTRNDSVWVYINRIYPDGKKALLEKMLFTKLKFMDSLSVAMAINGSLDKGTNQIEVAIDPENNIMELSESNNSALQTFEVTDEEMRPVFPYDLAIMNQPDFFLSASTVNPLQEKRAYRLQIDTTALFNSPVLLSLDTASVGGALSFKPALVWQNHQVYYWRTAPLVNGTAVNWKAASFQYIKGESTGAGQSHYFQHQQSGFNKITLDSTRQFAFGTNEQSLYAAHGIYGYSASEDSHFSFSVNGIQNIRSACVGQSLIFNLFDPVTFKQWENPNGAFGSGYMCGGGREYNFEFSYFPASNRKVITDFMDKIPKGTIVAVRAIVDQPFDSLQSKYWKKDTLIFGSGRSLYHSLYNQGFAELDSLNRTRTFAFVFKKDDSVSFKPKYIFSAGLYDRIQFNFFPLTTDTSGVITSPLLGPSTQWKEMTWDGGQSLASNLPSTATIYLSGKDSAGSLSLLKTYTPGSWNNDISDIDARKYPFIQMAMDTKEAKTAFPYQLNNWNLFYEPVAEGALSAIENADYNKPLLLRNTDSLKIGLYFKNVSLLPLAQTSAKITVTDDTGIDSVYSLETLKALHPNDTAMIRFTSPINHLSNKKYTVHIEVNAEHAPTEQHWFNNDAWFQFEIGDPSLPLTLLNFDALAEKQHSKLNWQTTAAKDDATFLIEHSVGNGYFKGIGKMNASNGLAGNTYEWLHLSPPKGNNYYRLRILHQNGQVEYSAVKKVFHNALNEFLVYPNPFKDKISIQGPEGGSPCKLELFDSKGRQLLMGSLKFHKEINTAAIPPGNYVLKISNRDNQKTIKIQKQ